MTVLFNMVNKAVLLFCIYGRSFPLDDLCVVSELAQVYRFQEDAVKQHLAEGSFIPPVPI